MRTSGPADWGSALTVCRRLHPNADPELAGWRLRYLSVLRGKTLTDWRVRKVVDGKHLYGAPHVTTCVWSRTWLLLLRRRWLRRRRRRSFLDLLASASRLGAVPLLPLRILPRMERD